MSYGAKYSHILLFYMPQLSILVASIEYKNGTLCTRCFIPDTDEMKIFTNVSWVPGEYFFGYVLEGAMIESW